MRKNIFPCGWVGWFVRVFRVAGWLGAMLAWAVPAWADEANWFRIEQVSPRVFAAVARPTAVLNGNAAVIVQRDHLIVVDCGSSPAAATALLRQIRAEISALPIRYLVLTHPHLDHAFGAAPFVVREKALVIGTTGSDAELAKGTEPLAGFFSFLRGQSPQLRTPAERAVLQEYLDQVPGHAVVRPDLLVDGKLQLTDGEHTVQVSIAGPGHTSGDLLIYVPAERVLITGDFVHGFEPLLGDVKPARWAQSIGEAGREFDFVAVVPGHGPVQRDRQTWEDFRRYLEELDARVRACVQDGMNRERTVAALRPESFATLRTGGYSQRIEAAWAASLHPIFRPTLEGAIGSNVQRAFELAQPVKR